MTPKQTLFVAEYLVDLNAGKAALRSGYSPNSAETIGFENLKKPSIAAAIQAEMDKRVEKIGITAEMVVREIGKLAFANLQDFYNVNGSLKEIHELPRDIAAALSSTKVNLTESCAVQEVKLHDKRGSLELLGRHFKLFTDKTELTGADGASLDLTVNFVKPE